ncbi:hypothetical protein BGW38_009729 [Lunasporangiospora selenospora]|uniref:Ribosomal RNA large subunit methyltransferase K/L-like methyltransferase domain-containing protein n=1 Tax=Lunasporangiospora selenospora TaxID=979761 RepID=A0A9P6FWW0_9FUNG|nr:hypothetical protein BGW38_009729 [Lunasporangiospora selenospora]
MPAFIDLFLAVPIGFEDIAVQRLPRALITLAADIEYATRSGYIHLRFPMYIDETIADLATEPILNDQVIDKLAALVRDPPISIFNAYIGVGQLSIPQQVLSKPEDLMNFSMAGSHNKLQEHSKEDNVFLTEPGQGPSDTSVTLDQSTLAKQSMQRLTTMQPCPNDRQWLSALSIFRRVCARSQLSEPLAVRLGYRTGSASRAAPTLPIRFRASFDRGNIQHKGIRSQDVAAALGGMAGDVFPEWKVDLKVYDIEVMGWWIEKTQGSTHVKSNYCPVESRSQSENHASKKTRLDQPQEEQHSRQLQVENKDNPLQMQISLTLPLAFSNCPHRYRPVDGRTSLKIEIAYNLLTFANIQPGDVVLDACAGVGTLPIVGAIHYPQSLFLGLELVPENIDKAATNAEAMAQRQDQTAKRTLRSHSRASLLLGDARVIPLRSDSVDLIISGIVKTKGALFSYLCAFSFLSY